MFRDFEKKSFQIFIFLVFLILGLCFKFQIESLQKEVDKLTTRVGDLETTIVFMDKTIESEDY